MSGGPVTTPYRAIFCDLRTDETIDVLPLSQVSFDDYIGKPGSLDGTVPLPNAELATRARRVEEGRTSVYLERGGDLWWGGIVWTRTLTSDTQGVMTLGIQAATFDSYASRRIIRRSLAYNGVDQLQIMRNLWDYMQQPPQDDPNWGGDIGVTYGDEGSTIFTSASWSDGDETVVADAISTLADTDTGFEHHIAIFRDPVTGLRVRQLQLGRIDETDQSPTGQVAKIRTGETDLVLDRPGSILSYTMPYDATRGGSTARARGADVSDDQSTHAGPIICPEVVADDLLAGGFPRVDLSSDHSTVTDTTTLTSLARAQLATSRGSVMIPDVTIRLDDLVPPALLGRTARIRITDAWFTEGLDARYRIIGVKVTPPERGTPETAELFLEDV
ncbi:hypothetical protein [Streptomyces sp. HPF1205]|uniref:hypothetical protein n=1 Tax=Streptomyces sp. HPF1205 TaxID=2873262 RepID=UPI001CEDF371|nr:hypothetical protein [Streptomyces sp. HPF1205]